MLLKRVFFIVLLGCTTLVFSQKIELSASAQISLLTCGSGSELYSSFGHSAFRVQDPTLQIDVVYNYGTFNFNTPNFYLKFVRGKLLYSLSREGFPNFLYDYELENRWVKEQLFNLTTAEKNELFQFLENNYLPENRDYKYDFFYNNCSTKIGDVLEETFGKKLVFEVNHLENQYTFRELIHQNLVTNSWASFGIDLALGSVIDKKATPLEHLFLPNYVFRQLNYSSIGQESLVQRERTILKTKTKVNDTYFLAAPLFWLSLLLCFVIIITYIDYRNETRSRRLDFFLFFVTGAIGIVILLLWFATDHSATVGNFNVFWGFPVNIVASFYLLRKGQMPDWLRNYFPVVLGLLLLTVVFWLLKIQVFSPLIIPVLITLGIRYLFLHLQFQKYNSK